MKKDENNIFGFEEEMPKISPKNKSNNLYNGLL